MEEQKDDDDDFNFESAKEGNRLKMTPRRVVVFAAVLSVFASLMFITTINFTNLVATPEDHHTVLAAPEKQQQTNSSSASDLADIISGSTATGDSNINNIITNIIGNAKTAGGFSVNATQDQLGAINNITTAIISSSATNIPKMDLAGKIASSQFNLQSGQIEATLFGNWSMHVESFSNTSLSADFALHIISPAASANGESTRDEAQTQFHINNLKINSFQQTSGNSNGNDVLSLRGTADLNSASESRQARSLHDVPISITIIQNKIMIITFDTKEGAATTNETGNSTGAADLSLRVFDNLPIIGITTSTSTGT